MFRFDSNVLLLFYASNIKVYVFVVSKTICSYLERGNAIEEHNKNFKIIP